MKQRGVIFAGGGTGGHIYPALAIAQALDPSIRAHFIVSQRDVDRRVLESTRAPGCQVSSTSIPAQPFIVRPKGLIRFARHWGQCVRTSRGVIRDALREGPVCVVSTGGFVAAPVVQAARVERAPVVAINLDAAMGKANRWIARHARARLSATPNAGSGWQPIAPIVRREAIAAGDVALCRRSSGLHEDKPTLLVTGGSLGAGSINNFMIAYASSDAGKRALEGWQILHQTGSNTSETEGVARAYAQANIAGVVVPFITSMGYAWGSADVCVCRAGAGNVSESWANRVPCVFMPYPYHKDGHQELNAMRLGAGGVIVKDRVEPLANLANAGTVLTHLLQEPDRRRAMRDALAALGPAEGASQVARAIEELLSA